MIETNTVEKMVIDRIRELGGDGLVDYDRECGCGLKDIAPCGHIGMDCEAGRVLNCGRCGCIIYIELSFKEGEFPCPGCGGTNIITANDDAPSP